MNRHGYLRLISLCCSALLSSTFSRDNYWLYMFWNLPLKSGMIIKWNKSCYFLNDITCHILYRTTLLRFSRWADVHSLLPIEGILWMDSHNPIPGQIITRESLWCSIVWPLKGMIQVLWHICHYHDNGRNRIADIYPHSSYRYWLFRTIHKGI